MTTATREEFDKEAIRERLKFAEVLRREFDVELRRAGSGLECLCPFHHEETPSFSIRHGEAGDSGYCFGCGWKGDIFKVWMESRGCDFPTAVRDLAGLCGVYPQVVSVGWKQAKPKRIEEGAPGKKSRGLVKAEMPPLQKMTAADLEALAAYRGLSVAGVRIAAHSFRRVAVCDWPQWRSKRTGQWHAADDAVRSWVITDEERWCAEYRRLDGGHYELKRRDSDQIRKIKAWSTTGMGWPIGAADMGRRSAVLLVEGGADLLAGYHFLHGFGLLDRVAVVAILGASNRIADEALRYFSGKRVRIVMDADEPKQVGEKAMRPSWEAAARWEAQLTAAGAAVEAFSLEGLTTASGDRVKDLNDLALCDEETLGSDEVLDLFFEWDF